MKKIVDSQKIRFTRLDLLNDPYEGIVDFEDIKAHPNINQKFIYCSCWTPETSESVILWAIYTKMKGVRIKVKSNLFFYNSDVFKCREIRAGFVPVSKIKSIPYADKELKGEIQEIDGPIKITYVNNLEEIYKDAIGTSIANEGKENEFLMYDISLYDLGIKKLDYWKFENEWRYRICPYKEMHGGKFAIENAACFPTPEYIDVPFNKDIEEILVGPDVLDEQIEDIKLFLESKRINIPILKSAIKINLK
ncbi:MAG: hypothetical protein NC489_36280 [Ruminococcus flavefaciens]|nr:hypothetical protein [Ruminococcus flavefaciens]